MGSDLSIVGLPGASSEALLLARPDGASEPDAAQAGGSPAEQAQRPALPQTGSVGLEASELSTRLPSAIAPYDPIRLERRAWQR